MGRLILEQMEFRAFHGYHAEEALVGHVFQVDIELDYDLNKAAEEDKLAETVDYQVVYQIVAKEMAKPSKLIENLAIRVKRALINEYAGIGELKVRISKLNPPVGGKMKRAIVEL